MKKNYCQSLQCVFALILSLSAAPQVLATKNIVTLPAGSVDGLAAAIMAAGPGGIVLLESGVHHESGTVLVDIPVTLKGEPGAILESAILPSPPPPPFLVEATIHIKGTEKVHVESIWFRPPFGANGATAVLVEDSPRVTVLNNTITDYQFGIIIQRGDRAKVSGNGIYMDPAFPGSRGIQLLNGSYIQVIGNEVASGFVGIFLAGTKGQCRNNVVIENVLGVMACKAQDGVFQISGSMEGSKVFASGWHLQDNEAYFNGWGYLVIDGSHHNFLVNNGGWGNTRYDVELAGESTRFGFVSPGTHNNLVAQGAHKGLVVKDCGFNNLVSGDVILVDNSTDPCF